MYQYPLYSLLKIFSAFFAVFLDLKYATIADPVPVILVKTTLGKLERKYFKFLIFIYFFNTTFSRSLFDRIKLLVSKNRLFAYKYDGFENFLTFEKIFFVEQPKFGITIKT